MHLNVYHHSHLNYHPQILTSLWAASNCILCRIFSRNPRYNQVPCCHCPSLLCPHCTILASLIFTLKFTQDWCYSNKAWAKLLRLPPHEISCCEHSLGDALNWCLWVSKAPAGCLSLSLSPNWAVVRSNFTLSSQAELDITHSFSTPPTHNPSPNSKAQVWGKPWHFQFQDIVKTCWCLHQVFQTLHCLLPSSRYVVRWCQVCCSSPLRIPQYLFKYVYNSR
jgi:hypothetical protein